MQDSLKAISISHVNATVNIREKLSLNEDECRNLYLKIKEILNIKEALILSTCNRVEVYYISDQDIGEKLILLLLLEKGINDIAFYKSYFIFYKGRDALRRMFEVSVGLESQVMGDKQIINQVKKAYQLSANVAMAGPFLHRLMHTIFYTNKRIVQETFFHNRTASVSYACTELIQELNAEVRDPRVLIIGLGEIGKQVAKKIAKTNIRQIMIANRTHDKALALAHEGHFLAVPMNEVWNEVEKADVVVSALQGKQDAPYLNLENFKGLRFLSKKLMIDLSVPRSIEDSIGMHPDVRLYNIDGLKKSFSTSHNKIKDAIPQVQHIISQSIEEFNQWSEEMSFSPAIHKFKLVLEEIMKQEMSRNLKYLNDHEKDKVEKITKGMIQKLIKLPVLQLKAACTRGEISNLTDVLNKLFNLEHKRNEAYQKKK